MREREESSQVPCALGLIETSANIERCSGHEPVFVRPNEALPPPFIERGAWCRAWASGVGVVLACPLTVPRACPRPVAPVDGVAMTIGRVVPYVG